MFTRTFLYGLLLLTLLFNCPFAAAQREADRWYFGNNAAISFASGTPRAVGGSVIRSSEGAASIADPLTGELQLYSNGSTVWNAAHEVLVNGEGLLGSEDAVQSAILVPAPGLADHYYLFTVADVQMYSRGPASRGWRYSTIDTKAADGRGAVLKDQKNQLLLDENTECQTVVRHCNLTDVWLISRRWLSNEFHCRQVSADGVHSVPVVSSLGISSADRPRLNQISCLAASPDGTMLAFGIGGFVELFSFDPQTGLVSDNRVLFDNVNAQVLNYALSFAPDNSKLYVVNNLKQLWQFDLSLSDINVIRGSRRVIAEAPRGRFFGMLQLAPDGRIYLAERDHDFLHAINLPNERGAKSLFGRDAVHLGEGRASLGLPSFVDGLFHEGPPPSTCQSPLAAFGTMPTVNEGERLRICAGSAIEINDESLNNPGSWEWEFEGGNPSISLERNPGVVTYNKPGVFRVRLIVANVFGADTLSQSIIVDDAPMVFAGNDTTLCRDQTLHLRASGEGSLSWYSAEGRLLSEGSEMTLQTDRSRRFTVVATNPTGCSRLDEIEVIVLDNIDLTLSVPTLDARVEPGDSLLLPVELASNISNLPGLTLTDSIYAELVLDTRGLRYRPGSVRGVGEATDWSFELRESAAEELLRLSGHGPPLRRAGRLCELLFDVYLSDLDTTFSAVAFKTEKSFAAGLCTDLQTVGGGTTIAELCLRRQRGIHVSGMAYTLQPVRPNPSRGSVRIHYTIALAGEAQLEVFDPFGRKVRTIATGYHTPQAYEVSVNNLDPGLYYYRLVAGSFVASFPLIVL